MVDKEIAIWEPEAMQLPVFLPFSLISFNNVTKYIKGKSGHPTYCDILVYRTDLLTYVTNLLQSLLFDGC